MLTEKSMGLFGNIYHDMVQAITGEHWSIWLNKVKYLLFKNPFSRITYRLKRSVFATKMNFEPQFPPAIKDLVGVKALPFW